MSFSVTKVRPFRSLGLYRSSGKHAAPRSKIELGPRQARPAHHKGGPRASEQKAA